MNDEEFEEIMFGANVFLLDTQTSYLKKLEQGWRKWFFPFERAKLRQKVEELREECSHYDGLDRDVALRKFMHEVVLHSGNLDGFRSAEEAYSFGRKLQQCLGIDKSRR